MNFEKQYWVEQMEQQRIILLELRMYVSLSH